MPGTPYFFVLGVPKSGTTWVQFLLNAHFQLQCRGEGKFLVFRAELTKAASHYSAGLGAMHRQVFGEELFPPMSRAEFDELYRAFMGIRLRSGGVADGVRRIGNKDPEHGMAITELSGHFPDAAYIHVIRDPRDLVVSAWHHLRRIDPGTAATIGDLATYAPMAVAKWSEYIAAVRARAAASRLDYCEITYESLHADGVSTLRRVLHFLGVDDDAPTASACLEQSSFERMSGGRKIGQQDPTSFYRQGAVGEWSKHMTSGFASELLLATEGLAHEFGYR